MIQGNEQGVELRIPHPKELMEYDFVEIQVQVQQLVKHGNVLDASGKPIPESDGILVLCGIKIPHEHISKFIANKQPQLKLFVEDFEENSKERKINEQ